MCCPGQLEPKPLAGNRFTGRLYCTPKALWKLNWFLRDFGYDPELLGRDEIDDKNLVGLCGVVKITHSVVNGNFLLNLDGVPAADAARVLAERGYGVWAHDNWYSLGLREKLPYPDSAVRVGLIHYNTAEEVDGLVRELGSLAR